MAAALFTDAAEVAGAVFTINVAEPAGAPVAAGGDEAEAGGVAVAGVAAVDAAGDAGEAPPTAFTAC